MVAAALLLSAAMPASHALTNSEIRTVASTPFEQRTVMQKRIVLGTLGGVPVVADHPCSDLCPAYTVRIIHFDLPPGPACIAAGGIERERWVPVSIAVSNQSFCVPAAIADLPLPTPIRPPR